MYRYHILKTWQFKIIEFNQSTSQICVINTFIIYSSIDEPLSTESTIA